MPDFDPEQLDRIAMRIRRQSVPNEEVERVMADLLTRSPMPRVNTPRTIKQSLRRPLVALAAAAMVVAGFVLWSAVGPQNLFAQVQAQVNRTRTAQFVYVLSGDALRDEIRYMENVLSEIAVVSKSADQQRAAELKSLEERVTQRLKIFREKADAGQSIESATVQILGPSRMRTEREGIHGREVWIEDTTARRSISLFQDEKRCVVFTDNQNGDAKPKLDIDLYAELTMIDAKVLVQAGERKLDGERLVGFHSVSVDGQWVWTKSYWVNPETKLPRLIESTARGRDGNVAAWTRAKVQFGLALDEAKFSTQPPAGYTVSEGKMMSVQDAKPAE